MGLKREDVIWFAEGVKTRYRLIVNRGAADAADILATLTPAQLDALQRQWDKANRKFVREYRLDDTSQEQRRAQAKRMLTPGQRARVLHRLQDYVEDFHALARRPQTATR